MAATSPVTHRPSAVPSSAAAAPSRWPSSAAACCAHCRTPSGHAAQKASMRANTASVTWGSTPSASPKKEAAPVASCQSRRPRTTASAVTSPATASVNTAATKPRCKWSLRQHQAMPGSAIVAAPSASKKGSVHAAAYRTAPYPSSPAAAAQPIVSKNRPILSVSPGPCGKKCCIVSSSVIILYGQLCAYYGRYP